MGHRRLLVVVLVALYGGHLYLWFRLAAAFGLRPYWLRDAAILTLLTSGGVLSLLVLRRYAPLSYRRSKWLLSFWIGYLVYALPFLIGGQVAGWAGAMLGRGYPTLSVVLPLALALLVVAYGLWEAARLPRVQRLEVTLDRLPPEAEGLTLVQLSDLHLSRLLRPSSLRRVVDQVNSLHPDLVVITGDTIDSVEEVFPDLDRFLAELARLRPRLGSYAVTGNHELYTRAYSSIEHLRQVGIRVLANETVEPVPGLRLVGIHDFSSKNSRRREFRTPVETLDSLVGSEAREHPTILLYHQPLFAERFAGLGVDLMLSGHTHAGQVWPFGKWSKRSYQRFSGLYRVEELRLYVSPGLGTSGPPLRVGARREMTLILLHGKKK